MKQDTLTQIMAFAHSIAHYLGTWIVALVQTILPMAKGSRHSPIQSATSRSSRSS